MKALIDTLYGILQPHTAVGQTLEGLTILRHDHEGLKENTLLLRRDREDMISQAGKIKVVTGRVLLIPAMLINQRNGGALLYTAAEDAVEVWAKETERVIMANPSLILDPDFPNGFTQFYEDTHVLSKEYNLGERQGAFWAFCEMTLQVKYIYRDGSIARS